MHTGCTPTLSKTGAPEIEMAVRSQSTLRQSVSQLCAFCFPLLMSDRSKSVAVAPLARPQHAAHHTSRPPLSKDGRVGQCRVCACRTYGRGAPPRAQTAHPRSPAVPATRPRAAAGPPRPSSAPSLPRPERRAARFDSTLHLTPGTRRVATQAGLVSAVYNTYGICVWSN